MNEDEKIYEIVDDDSNYNQMRSKPSKISQLFKVLGGLILGLAIVFVAINVYDKYFNTKPDDQKPNQLKDGTEQAPLPELIIESIWIPEGDYDDYVYNLVDVNKAKWEDILSKYVTISSHDDYLQSTTLDFFHMQGNYLYFYTTSRGNTGTKNRDSYEYRNIISYELSPNNAEVLSYNYWNAPQIADFINYILDNFQGECVSQISGTVHVLSCINPVAELLLKKLDTHKTLVAKIYGGIKDKDKAYVLAVNQTHDYAFVEIEIPNSEYDNAGCLTEFLYVGGYNFDAVFKKATYGWDRKYYSFVNAYGVEKIYETENN